MVPRPMTGPSAAQPAPEGAAELHLTRADIGFSAAHFSVIDGRAERLHGHNYRVSLRARGEVGGEGTVIDFHVLKDALRTLCKELDERMLLPGAGGALSIESGQGSVTVQVGARRYVFPEDDVCLLPVSNTTCECLAAYLLDAVRNRLGTAPVRLEVGVEELPGQGASVEEL